jgi:hypothetical protein
MKRLDLVFDLRILGRTEFPAWSKLENLVQFETSGGFQNATNCGANAIKKRALKGQK